MQSCGSLRATAPEGHPPTVPSLAQNNAIAILKDEMGLGRTAVNNGHLGFAFSRCKVVITQTTG